ncbi:hypothetical protein N7453_007480 [Penicillium expansum]|nr:hypothetical protein N7453_007480 [Penicillium expansum]
MIHHTVIDDDPNSSYLRRPSGPFASEPPSGPPHNRPSSRSSRPSSRTRMVKPPGAVIPTGLGVLTENVANLSPEGLGATSPIKEGLGSLNRWSQSTASSKSPSEYMGHHRRGSSKMSMSGYNRRRGSHSPQRAQGLNGLPMHDLPELERSAIFNHDSTSQQLDLSFAASSHLFQPSTHSIQTDMPMSRSSEGSIYMDDGEGDSAAIQHGQTQKVMLSKALQKANTAVLLDNAANFEGAMEAYTDACNLLQLVMVRSNGGDEEKHKLQEIRDTYMLRVTELHRMDFPLSESDDKALPDRPLSQESYGELLRSTNDGSYIGSQQSSPRSSFGFHQIPLEEAKGFSLEAVPPRRQSLRPSALEDQPRSVTLLAGSPEDNNESTSWLDTIDESGASSPSSANSKASSVYLRRRTSRRLSNDTEAEFDAALDAAVEAAYDEGLEPVPEHKEDESDDVVSNARRNIQLAKQRVREAEQEAEAMNRDRELRRIQEQTIFGDDPITRTSAYLDDEAEEEERLLEEMTKGYVMDDFEFGIQSKSALPRESDSSNMPGRTWESSATSNAVSTRGALSTLAEDDVLPLGDLRPEPYTMPSSPPSSALPPLPASSDFPAPSKRASISNRAGSIGSLTSSTGPGVRARRLSSHTRELKIETNTRSSRANSNASSAFENAATSLANRPPPLPKDDASALGSRSTLHPTQRNPSISSFTDHVNLSKARTHEDDENELPPLPLSARPMGKVPSAPDGLNKLHSNTKPFRTRNASVPIQIPDMCPESPSSPWSGAFPDTQRGATSGVPVLPTPTLANFSFNQNGLPSGGLNLFGSNIHSPTALGRPNSLVANAPLPLEPCPEGFLLRPFWLMRCLYQTLAHPHGGYLSEKLFIPRDVWRVKNVKLKALEEKVSNCDLLTAALLKLAQVDTYDADAVLEEDAVVRYSSMPLFKPASTPDEPVQPEVAPNKSYSTWKRLRAKTSGLGTTTPVPSARDSNKDNLLLNSVPMTSVHGTPAKRNVTQLEFSGPNANYMGALARLFDAAQVLEQIAQQVEDPGLKHSSKTHVGLELSTRHAAEFFGFYICRFALGDVGLMLDKFIKRGSEWVLV